MMQGGSPWSAHQRRWLQALGHAVLRVGGDAEREDAADAVVREAAAAPVSPGPATAGGARAPGGDIAPRRPPAPPVAAVPPSVASDASARAAMRRPARMPDRLQLALLRASGLDPADPDAQATMAQWPVERLRGDATAKRAFWPQLRALRRRTP
jgi:hypothetical protein